MAATAIQTPGEILPEAFYTLDEFERRTKLGAAAIRKMRREGLKVRYPGRIGLILGRDFIDHIMRTAPTDR